ncbi:hypothetical protein [Virgibacillus siamensis]|uniref:hypothetical protein n=1 Tax=Virgibacillus siamensis TaxID=480071 RepID=UPI00098545F9|nr:hypothetical protein [Virgibacillus siamensis]
MALTIKERIQAKNNGLTEVCVISRIRRGWNRQTALTAPKRTKQPRSEWCEIAIKNGISERLFNQRIDALGFTQEEAATTPKGGRRNSLKKWIELAEQNGISKPTFDKRMYALDWDKEKAATEPLHTERRKNK